jgi:hypothetical protein
MEVRGSGPHQTHVLADSDEVGQLFRRDVGHAFRFQAGHDSDLKSAT